MTPPPQDPATDAQAAADHETGPADLSHRAHLQVIGYIGLLLPILLVGLASIRPTPGVPSGGFLSSVSAYYYTGAVAIFTGLLFALSLFLLTYRGYKDAVADRIIGFIGCVAALCVAVFPTMNPYSTEQLPWWSMTTRTVHYVGAVTLFTTFALFSLWLFRKTSTPKGQPLPKAKARRNLIFLVCGIAIVACVAWAGLAGRSGASIFWPEVGALWAFAVSWLTKGRAIQSAREAAKRAPARLRGMVTPRG